ncbi:uncharacterized protein TNCV_18441 [Trichonephila clavipes]|nr:uncharacterized protein TNCV_18441 [Trichonephila clavipes]
MDHVILNHGQVTWTTPELAPLLLTATPHPREDVSALDIFNVDRCPTRPVFSGTGLELVTRQPVGAFGAPCTTKYHTGAYIEVSRKHSSQRREGLLYKHPCLTRDSNPASRAPQLASLTTVSDE